jgi:hypothetical protein
MKKLFACFLLFCLSNSLYVQNDFDSLLNVLDKTVDNYQIFLS